MPAAIFQTLAGLQGCSASASLVLQKQNAAQSGLIIVIRRRRRCCSPSVTISHFSLACVITRYPQTTVVLSVTTTGHQTVHEVNNKTVLSNNDETIQTITIHIDRRLYINLCTLIKTAPMWSYCVWSVYKTINQQISTNESCLLLWIALFHNYGIKIHNFVSHYEISQVNIYPIILTFKLTLF